MSSKNLYIFLGLFFLVFIGTLIFFNEVQAQVITRCEQLPKTTCENRETSYICYPQWCGGPEVDVNGGINTVIKCRHRPCEWNGSSCVETGPGDESDDTVLPCVNIAPVDCSLGWELVAVSQGWCTIDIKDDECVGRKWCDLYKEKQDRIYYCEGKSRDDALNSGEGVAACGYTLGPQGTIKEGEETCECRTATGECNPQCAKDADCLAQGYTGDVTCEDCECVGGAPPECPKCEEGVGKGLVPCGRSCYVEGEETPEVCQPCQFCHLFIMLDRILDFILFTLVPIIAVLMIVIGGAMFFLAGESLERVADAKRILTSVVIGLVIIYGAWLIINTFFSLIGLAETDFGRAIKDWYTFPCP